MTCNKPKLLAIYLLALLGCLLGGFILGSIIHWLEES